MVGTFCSYAPEELVWAGGALPWRIVQAKRGIPTLIIEADMTDARSFAESQVETRIDAFMELLKL